MIYLYDLFRKRNLCRFGRISSLTPSAPFWWLWRKHMSQIFHKVEDFSKTLDTCQSDFRTRRTWHEGMHQRVLSPISWTSTQNFYYLSDWFHIKVKFPINLCIFAIITNWGKLAPRNSPNFHLGNGSQTLILCGCLELSWGIEL